MIVVYFSFTNSCTLYTDPKSWTLYFDISKNEFGVDVGCLLIDLYSNRTYLVVQLELGCIDTIVEYETLIQGLRKAINMNVKYIEVFGGSQKVIKQVNNSMHCISNGMGNF